MEIRQATAQDADRIREIAESSFQASYALSPLDIETIVEGEFAVDPLSDRIEAGSPPGAVTVISIISECSSAAACSA
jgi:hypothetical protein